MPTVYSLSIVGNNAYLEASVFLPAQLIVLSVRWADRPVSERTIPAETEVFRLISYGSADFDCLSAPPDFGK